MSDLAGTATLVRLFLRRDRVLIPSWVAVFAVTASASASAGVDLYPTATSRVEAAEALNRSQALVALYGRIYDPDSVGAIGLVKLGGFGAVMVALLSVVIVIRHTRGDEEAGRAELIGASVSGRRAPLAAALIVALVTNAALAVFTAAGLAVAGLPVDGSVAFGLAWGGVGVAFAAVAAVAAQLTTAARAATGLCAATLGVVYALRAVGDTAETAALSWLTWLSPVGWAQQFRPYAGNRWWVLGITLGFALATAAAAMMLRGRRDLGTGLLADRLGPPRAAPGLRSPLALAWRLQRGALVAWTVAFVLLGMLVGAIASSVGDFLNNPSAQDFILRLGGQKGLIDAFLSVELAFTGIFTAAYAVSAVSRLRSEEVQGHAEAVLASAVSRTRWALSHVVVAVGGTILLVVATGLGAGTVRSVQTGDAAQLGRLLAAALVQLPACWVLAGLALALFGLVPRWTVGAWVVFAFFVLLGELGPLFELSHWVMDLSPFAHVPRLPGGPFSAVPLAVLAAVAAALAGAGLAGLRARDVA